MTNLLCSRRIGIELGLRRTARGRCHEDAKCVVAASSTIVGLQQKEPISDA
jgi:hypothetical protein